MDNARRIALNALMRRIEAIPLGTDLLSWVKTMVAETLKLPGATEEDKIKILAEMENGGYEALLHMLMTTKIPADFDPNNPPWNRH
jgi:hypothetical protein